MIRFILTFTIVLLTHYLSFTQIIPHKDFPILFHDVQTNGVFSDSKTFPDCASIVPVKKLDSCYLAEKATSGFNLKDYVKTYFVIPEKHSSNFQSDTSLSVQEHIKLVWDELINKAGNSNSSLIELPHPYIVPGGRFSELYYWDSYFTMLGLAEAGEIDIVEKMINNFAWMLDTFAFIPNGNRTYYLTRSQPPFFGLMVDLLAQHLGNQVYSEYLPYLEIEYAYWMKGEERIDESQKAYKHIVRLDDGTILNRYWDSDAAPRPEAYLEDMRIAELSPLPDSIEN